MNTQTQVKNMIVYISEKGRIYVEIDDRLYEMELGADVTEEMFTDLEVIKTFDPSEDMLPGLEVIKLFNLSDADGEIDEENMSEMFYNDPYGG